ncbi:dioxygenase family protein [Chondromyces apiculatus]|uniref:Protocatechuate 3,4-dioxygenase beta chain n=1 Tax=Chondromyces apiculatus DSM 436 TaxID=1192034 RepID=A0A017SXH4_9BACT|nr:hypothetical protein [Chondromyces apiculatus]EYF01648.1 Protocatechuate 3,4-dioxygenase beta chain [Chondromyces apiculatus DSM 436]
MRGTSQETDRAEVRMPWTGAMHALKGTVEGLLHNVRDRVRGARGVTVWQDEGPYYPGHAVVAATGSDLTRGFKASGRLFVLKGQVTDAQGSPVRGAEVQIWQTDDLHGRYLVEPSRAPRDPNFAYMGTCLTDTEGSFAFTTVRPRDYGIAFVRRAPHIHVKVFVGGLCKLTTQGYFDDERAMLGRDFVRALFLRTEQDREATVMKVERSREATQQAGAEVQEGSLHLVLAG